MEFPLKITPKRLAKDIFKNFSFALDTYAFLHPDALACKSLLMLSAQIFAL